MKKGMPFPPKPSNKTQKPSAKAAQEAGMKKKPMPFSKGGMAKKGC